ncbi:MAG: PotD/PotF family extracellular solute-binding protein [Actinomycetota bacterium]|jgi:spermidine/putrescine transport system substrate-binding protein
MTDDPRSLPGLDAALARGLTSRRMSRRNMIKLGGISVGTLSVASILAACSSSSGGSTGGTQSAGSVNFDPSTATSKINFANWPLYIDKSHGTYPSLEKFTNETGIDVTYNDEINDNASFFGEILPQLRAGQDTGRDIIVITNGEYLAALIANGWATELDPAFRPNFDKNAASWAKSPFYDEGNKHTMAWQSGLTGIGYNTTLVNKAPTKLDDLMSTDYFPPSSVGILKEDAPNLVMVNLGIDPKTSGQDEWNQAADWLKQLRDSDTFYNAYDQGYVDDLNARNLSGTMAWSGDVLYYKIWAGKPYEFIMPENGALLWIDNMLIPANSKNPAGALELMDFYYNPENAQMLTEYILYMSPVPAVQPLIAKHAQQETGTYATQLDETAKNPMLWPDQELLNQVSLGRNLTTDEESKAWHDTFDPIWEQ